MSTPVASAARAAAAGQITAAPRKRAAAPRKRAAPGTAPRGRTAPGTAPGATPPAGQVPAPAAKAPPAARKKAAPARGKKLAEGVRARTFAPVALPGGASAHKAVVAEYLLCIVLIGASPVLTRTPGDGGRLYVANDFVRLSAVSLLFFVLALMSTGRSASRAAAAFGALVTLGTLYNARGAITAAGGVFAAAKTSHGATKGALPGTATVDVPVYTPVDLSANPLAQAGQTITAVTPVPAPGQAT
jgi:hypothetical protein